MFKEIWNKNMKLRYRDINQNIHVIFLCEHFQHLKKVSRGILEK